MHLVSSKNHATAQRLGQLAAMATSLLLMTACSTGPTMGENKGVVTGAVGGSSAEAQNSALESCGETLGTLAIEEDTNAPWYYQLRDHQLGSTVPVLRMMIQQSNCFVIVERGKSMNNVMREREFARGEESRAGSNFGKGQLVAADYTMSPSIQFSGKTGGGSAFGGGGTLGMIAGLAANVSRNEASTTLLLIDNRSGVQISASEGSAKNFDFGGFGAAFGGGGIGGGGGYSKTPQGKVVMAAFADSYNQMVKALRNYKAQTVKGGLGTGGRLGVQGGDTAASREIDAKPRPKSTKKKQ
ncbi:CsgG/HfaB family protein [Aquabacterium sp. CECT 9606]|uniref:CsgG/HfaB family protein n=1 Tax=Aquabacterium sp. CECT 9606 TaxID=2845822 RepID=UPI001E55E5AC|nr:CsgG/HfaB family protein [Aquabacterium sp. CECT 9606]CAH0354429.1 hypothetical protein AQB9606_03712 [Aquabacterium sp. CECT 9606]